MNYFKTLRDQLQRNMENHHENYYNCIPFTMFPKLEKILPGVEQETYYCVTASSGIKTKK